MRMVIGRLARGFLWAGLLLAAGAASAGGKDRLQAFLNGVESLQANFEQSVFDTSQGQARSPGRESRRGAGLLSSMMR